MIRFPRPLRSGDRVGVTAPSAGVPAPLLPRFRFCLEQLHGRGYELVLGECVGEGDGIVSAPAQQRAAELTRMLTDPTIAAIVPPWGGELGVDLVPRLDWDAITASPPTWLIGYSDISTLLLALTVVTGTASVHAANLMELPYPVPAPLVSWLDVTTGPSGAAWVQGPSGRHGRGGFEDWVGEPQATQRALDRPGGWQVLRPRARPERARGRLLGGCLETVSVLAGSRFGNLDAFRAAHAPEGLIVYLEVAEHTAFDAARDLWALRLAGWFDHATAVLIGRTTAPDSRSCTQRDAVASVLGDLDLPVVLDVDVGHVPPQMTLVNGALAELTLGDTPQLVQQLTGVNRLPSVPTLSPSTE